MWVLAYMHEVVCWRWRTLVVFVQSGLAVLFCVVGRRCFMYTPARVRFLFASFTRMSRCYLPLLIGPCNTLTKELV